MGLLKTVRKFNRLLRGGATPAEIFLGAFLGCILGMVPGFNATLLIALFLLFLLNANMGVALLCYGASKPLSVLLAPFTFRLGYFLIHDAGVDRMVRKASEIPVLAYMDLHVYCLLGGLVLGIAGGFLAGLIFSEMLSAFRKGIIEPVEQSAAIKRVMGFFPFRIITWLAFGRRKEAQEDVLFRKFKLFRRGGLIAALAAVVLAAGVEFFLLDWLLAKGVESGVGSVVGAETNVREAHFSLLGASGGVRGLQVTDPAEPTRNLVQAADLEADVSVSSLLANRCVIDSIEVDEVRLGTERDRPGEVYRLPKEPEPDEEGPSLPEFFQHGKKLLDYLKKAEDYLSEYERKAQPPVSPGEEREREEQRKSRLLAAARNEGYFELSASDILSEKPTVVVRRLGVKSLLLAPDAPPWHFEASGISTHPHLLRQPLVLQLFPVGELTPLVDVEFRFYQPERPHSIKVNLGGLAIGGAIKLSDKAPVDVEGGVADLTVDGTFTSTRLDVPFTVVLRNFKATLREGRSLLGLDPAASARVLDALSTLTLSGRIRGSLSRPRLKVDVGRTLAGIRDVLAKAGREELSRVVNEQRQKVEREVREKIEEARSVVGEKLEETKSRLEQKAEEELDKARQKAADEAGRVLENLFKR